MSVDYLELLGHDFWEETLPFMALFSANFWFFFLFFGVNCSFNNTGCGWLWQSAAVWTFIKLVFSEQEVVEN